MKRARTSFGFAKLALGATLVGSSCIVVVSFDDYERAPSDASACDDAALLDDKNHCGSCGHSCLGGECNNGKCQPVGDRDWACDSGLARDRG